MGNAKSIFAVLIGAIFSSWVSLLVTGIIVMVAFVAGLSTLIYYGLVSALIYSFGAFLLAAFVGLVMGKDGLDRHWHSFLFFVALIPTGLLFGWFSDHMSMFGLSLVPMATQQFSLSQNAWDESTSAMVSGSYIIASVALGLAIFAAALVYVKGKNKRKR